MMWIVIYVIVKSYVIMYVLNVLLCYDENHAMLCYAIMPCYDENHAMLCYAIMLCYV